MSDKHNEIYDFEISQDREPVFGILNVDLEDLKGLMPFVRIFFDKVPKSFIDRFQKMIDFASLDEDDELVFSMDFVPLTHDCLTEQIHMEIDGSGEIFNLTLTREEHHYLRDYLDTECQRVLKRDVKGLVEEAVERAQKKYGKPSDPKVFCNRCGYSFVPKPEREKWGDLEAVVFECPTCHRRYVAYCTDSQLRESIRRYTVELDSKKGYPLTESQERFFSDWKNSNLVRGRDLVDKFVTLKGEKYGEEEYTTVRDG